jgi:hypothetical protein
VTGDGEADVIGGGKDDGRACGDGYVPPVGEGGGSAFGFNAKAVVVSAFVPVIGGSVSPGPWIVEVTPAAEPSSTVS